MRCPEEDELTVRNQSRMKGKRALMQLNKRNKSKIDKELIRSV